MKISKIHARQILDSRGNPTVECDVVLDSEILGRAAVPSGASTGEREAVELRDKDSEIYNGKGVLKAIGNVNSVISKELVGRDVTDQTNIDEALIKLDGTENKSHLGANATLAVSLAVSHAAAAFLKKPLFEYVHSISNNQNPSILPLPMFNLINGGRHAEGSSDIQEFMVIPVGAQNFSQALRMGSEIFHELSKVLKEKGYQTTVGDEGGYAPFLKEGNKEALELLCLAVEKAGYEIKKDIVFALDVAASEFFKEEEYHLSVEGQTFGSDEMVDWIVRLTHQYPIISIEDGLDQNDWNGWNSLTEKVGKDIQVVGDDLLVTNVKYLKKAIKERVSNAILIKPNQIGTLTETIQAVQIAQQNGFNTIMSHRSGETEDTTIAHLAVGLSCGQIKSGSLSRSERIAKYNELLRIEEMLGDKAQITNPFKLSS